MPCLLSDSSNSSLRPLAFAICVAVAGLASAPVFAGNMVTSGLQSGEQYDQFIVKYRDGSIERRSVDAINRGLERATRAVGSSMRGATAKRGGAAGAAPKARHFRRMALGADVVRIDRKIDRVDAETLMRQIASDPSVEYVEVDARMYPVLTPNDPSYSQQWGYSDADAGIRANQAWDVSTGSGIIVAVLDTGITNHPDLNANIVAGYDFISDTFVSRDGNGRDSDPSDPGDWSPVAGECYTNSPVTNSSWHGTHVAGTVAAVTNNSTGVAGTAFGAKVMPVRVLGRCGGLTSDIADAITWASGGTVSGVTTLTGSNVPRVINMSLGGGGACSATYQNAINGAVGRGVTVVVAAGNSNANAANFQPASCANVINVASVTSSSSRSSFSNYGTSIDVSAPGSSILSTLNSGTTTPGSASYASYNGTSMATPHVAGTVALVQSRRTAVGLARYTPSEMETLLKNTAYALAGTCSGGCGAGIINAKAAVDAAGGGGGGGAQTYTNTADYAINDNATVNSPITVSGRTGNAPAATTVSVNIVHTYIGDLLVQLVAPDGSLYTLHNRAGGSADNIVQNYTVNLSTEALNGTWNLRVNDNYSADTGYINSWSITF